MIDELSVGTLTSAPSDELLPTLQAIQRMATSRLGDRLSVPELVQALLSLMESYDPELPRHGVRTACSAVTLGRAVCLTEPDLDDLQYAACLHDIGKLLLPKRILEKEGPLTYAEYAVVQSHPREGAHLLYAFPSLRTPSVWIAHHHERWDGCGYPYGLRGTYIPLGARILAVADTYDRLISRNGVAHTPASVGTDLDLLRIVGGSQLDPKLVELFVRLRKIPKGCDDSAGARLRPRLGT